MKLNIYIAFAVTCNADKGFWYIKMAEHLRPYSPFAFHYYVDNSWKIHIITFSCQMSAIWHCFSPLANPPFHISGFNSMPDFSFCFWEWFCSGWPPELSLRFSIYFIIFEISHFWQKSPIFCNELHFLHYIRSLCKLKIGKRETAPSPCIWQWIPAHKNHSDAVTDEILKKKPHIFLHEITENNCDDRTIIKKSLWQQNLWITPNW